MWVFLRLGKGKLERFKGYTLIQKRVDFSVMPKMWGVNYATILESLSPKNVGRGYPPTKCDT